jgi:hypothetical protein
LLERDLDWAFESEATSKVEYAWERKSAGAGPARVVREGDGVTAVFDDATSRGLTGFEGDEATTAVCPVELELEVAGRKGWD